MASDGCTYTFLDEKPSSGEADTGIVSSNQSFFAPESHFFDAFRSSKT
jgi:hypothetical protein